MSHYGITAIRWNAQHTEVESCVIHEVGKDGNDFVLLEGRPMSFYSIASLIIEGEKVWVMSKDAAGAWDKHEPVKVRKHSQQEYLYTAPENSLFGLPTF